ncbi:DUF2726 domain-containing protein [Nostoc sp. CHAB 5834]|nr:DUF2726 domain-containing protein [Nostoc sp. CHAB 5834]
MSLKFVVIVSVLVVALLLLAYAWLYLHNKIFGNQGFKSRRFITDNEIDFYNRISAALDSRFVVFPQVAMGALIDTTLKSTSSKYWKERAKFQSKICDFVICTRSDLSPCLIVELDDVMHDFKKDKTRDEVMAKAGFQTIRFWSRNKPSIADLKKQLELKLALH